MDMDIRWSCTVEIVSPRPLIFSVFSLGVSWLVQIVISHGESVMGYADTGIRPHSRNRVPKLFANHVSAG